MPAPSSYEAWRRKARRRLPQFAFDFVDGGAGAEIALARNCEALAIAQVTPRLGLPLSCVDLSISLFGRTYAAPVGLAPVGLAGIVRPDADRLLARAAADRGLPFVLSATASTPLEEIAAITPPWFQLYVPERRDDALEIVTRANQAGCPVLVVTVDMPAAGLRRRDLANDLRIGAPSLRMILDAARRPAWSLRRVVAGPFAFPNQVAHPVTGPADWAARVRAQTGGLITWDFLQRIRDRWPRAMVLKGVLDPEVACRAHAIGCDGVVVSNHGGRQLDCAPAAFEALPDVVASCSAGGEVLFDSGARSGEDVLKVADRGAAMTFVGRLPLLALAAAGARGLEACLDNLIDETRRAFALAGKGSAAAVSRTAGFSEVVESKNTSLD